MKRILLRRVKPRDGSGVSLTERGRPEGRPLSLNAVRNKSCVSAAGQPGIVDGDEDETVAAVGQCLRRAAGIAVNVL